MAQVKKYTIAQHSARLYVMGRWSSVSASWTRFKNCLDGNTCQISAHLVKPFGHEGDSIFTIIGGHLYLLFACFLEVVAIILIQALLLAKIVELYNRDGGGGRVGDQ